MLDANLACGLALGIIFAVWIVLAYWVYRDAEDRGMAGAIWALLVLAFGPFAFGLYLGIRPRSVPVKEHPVEYPPPLAPPPGRM